MEQIPKNLPGLSLMTRRHLGQTSRETGMLHVPKQRSGVLIKPQYLCTHSEISCKNLEGQEGLRQLIFHVTCNMKDVGSTIGCQKLAGRLVSIPPHSLRPEAPISHYSHLL